MVAVNPDILQWARETAGLSVDDAARKVGLTPARGLDRTARLLALERGEDEPSRVLLAKMAAAYRRPLLSFYLAEPPARSGGLEDFRALPDRRPETEPLVQALVRDVRARQTLVRNFLEDEEAPRLPFIGSQRTASGVAVVAAAIAQGINFDLQRFRAAVTVDAAFAYLRECVEAAGAFVLLIGDLGSHHSELDTEAFRGFALADPFAPFVVVNDRDAHSAWSFTLLHEVAHLWLGVSGVSGARADGAVERFCNDVASHILLPREEARNLVVDGTVNTDGLATQITALAQPRRLSRTLLALRLFQAGAITEVQWEALRTHFREQWRNLRAQRREGRQPGQGGPNPYVVRRHHLGKALLAVVERAVSEGALSPTKAGKVLGVRPRSVATLLQARAA